MFLSQQVFWEAREELYLVLVFILLGAVGIPVFANFSGGIGVLVGPTGGYIIGFFIFRTCDVGDGETSW